MDAASNLILIGQRATARALLLGDRVDTSELEHDRVLSTNPLAFPAGKSGVVTLFRYGVVVLIGLTPIEQDEVLASIARRVKGGLAIRDEEAAIVELSADTEDHISPRGTICIKAISAERLLVISDALAKSVVLAHDEAEVASVFDVIEPLARELAEHGRAPVGRRAMLRHIGKALLVQHRVSGRVAVAEKPDVLWDRPDLERLYGRLEDEYELKERVGLLNRKLAVITETATAFTDIIDTERSLRLELIIVALIVFEIVITFYQMVIGR
ncbi:MAG TPA: RMD1 family protein [Micropepsaceae bacterium]|nr:RMD1 family protein [Micropepsaceae bacterium]